MALTTQQEITVTLHAQTAFQDAANDLTSIKNAAIGSNEQLMLAMQSPTGSILKTAISGWADTFAVLVNQLQSIADQLGNQAQTMQKNEQDGVDIASGLASITLG